MKKKFVFKTKSSHRIFYEATFFNPTTVKRADEYWETEWEIQMTDENSHLVFSTLFCTQYDEPPRRRDVAAVLLEYFGSLALNFATG